MFNKNSNHRVDQNLKRKDSYESSEDCSFNSRQFQLPEKFFDKVLEIERQIDEMQANTPHDLLQTLMALYSDAIEYYGANDDHEMCIDLNMRMQSVLVRPYILDCLCEHNQLTTSQTENFKGKLYGILPDEAQPEEQDSSVDYDVKTNFESDKRRKTNPFKKIFKRKNSIRADGSSTPKGSEGGSFKQKGNKSPRQIDSSSTTTKQSSVEPSDAPKSQSVNTKPDQKPMKIISQSSSPGVRDKVNAQQKGGTTHNERLVNLIATKSNKTKEEVLKEMTIQIDKMSESSDDEIDMTMFEDVPKVIAKEGDEDTEAPVVQAPPPYKALKDNHDYGQSDNEEQTVQRMSRRKKTKQAEEKALFYDSDKTDDLTKEHENRKYGKTRARQNIRYALNRQVVHVHFKLVDLALILNDDQDVDDSIVFNRVTKDSNNFQKLQKGKKKAQIIIQNYLKEHKFEIQERIKERKIAKLKRNTKRNLNSNLTATATILNKGDTSNIMDNPIDYEDNDEFDYVQVDDDTMNDVSQSDIMELTQAMGNQAKEGRTLYERKPAQKTTANGLRQGGFANSVLTGNQPGTGMSGQPLTSSPKKKNLKMGTGSDQLSQLQTVSPLQVGKNTSLKNTSANNVKQLDDGKMSGEGEKANAGSGSFIQSKSGNSSNFNILRVQNCEDIDNPDEMNKIENQEGEFSEDDDPEQLDEMERRKEEIEESFTEKSLQMKHDLIEKISKEIEDEFDSEHEDEMDAKLSTEIKKVNKEMDQKRQESKQILRKKLNEIIQDQDQTIEVKLQKLYDQAEITQFIDSLLN